VRKTVWIATDMVGEGARGFIHTYCVHCGEPVIKDSADMAECEHGICHAGCLLAAGCDGGLTHGGGLPSERREKG
jgi:hypothetical protein